MKLKEILTSLFNSFLNKSISDHLKISLLIRIVILFWSFYQDATFTVKFTDVDYHVFNEAAEEIYLNNGSPYKRHTYRYSPLLAYLLLPGWYLGISAYFGKIIFILSDLAVGWLNFKICNKSESKTYLLWLYNPIAIAVSVRGNAESLIAVPILLSIYYLQNFHNSKIETTKSLVLSAFFIGLAIHLKIYPVSYAFIFWFSFFDRSKGIISSLFINKHVIKFGIICAMTIISLTIMFYQLYGDQFLNEYLFYHFNRSDIRHNFSPYFYPMYLAQFYKNPSGVLDRKNFPENYKFSRILGLIGFTIQFLLILAVSIKFSPMLSSDKDWDNNDNTHKKSSKITSLGYQCFITTLIFVTFNKVCTSQYFLWYLALLPSAMNQIEDSKRSSFIFLGLSWLLGQGVWLNYAYYLEFQGQNYFFYLLCYGCLFMIVDCVIISSFIVFRKKIESNEIAVEDKKNQ